MDFVVVNNPIMDICTIISTNLTAWMDSHPSLNTLKKLSAKSGVGFGTVQRVSNGNGNPTISNLESIAGAFGKSAIELLSPPPVGSESPAPMAAEPAPSYEARPVLNRVICAIEKMDESSPVLTALDVLLNQQNKAQPQRTQAVDIDIKGGARRLGDRSSNKQKDKTG